MLSGLLLHCEGNQLTVTGTDLDLTIRVESEVIGIDDGSGVVPARLSADIVRSLEPGAVTIEGGDEKVEISASRSRFGLRAFPVVEFPTWRPPRGRAITLPGPDLVEGLRQVVRAASSDDARPLLTGVLLTNEDGGCGWWRPTRTAWPCATCPGGRDARGRRPPGPGAGAGRAPAALARRGPR